MRHMYSLVPSEDLLSSCYNHVQRCRPSMAINPGFVRQLDLFRRMECGLLALPSEKLSSRAYASFRSFRAKTQYREHSTVLQRFRSISYESLPGPETSRIFYSCIKCRTKIFYSCNVLDEWTKTSMLPISTYWADSLGGKEYKSQQATINICTTKIDMANFIEIEPLDWMLSQMLDSGTGLLFERGKLNCPCCYSKIGFWDWKFPKSISAIFIQNTKVVNF